ncbi:MAG TPA: phosphoribosylglycinamide formyltransferase [Steroidobacteraceae bacterium]|nr:phosphoribosylglycinamide formyltransferase [Steroidobacteraceae bacterium]
MAGETAAGRLRIEIATVLSDREDAAVLDWAASAGLRCETLTPGNFPDRDGYDRALAERVEHFRPGLVVLAGFMRILSPVFVDRFEGRMLNIHPSLLPRHRGLHTHRRVLEAGDPAHGASVHFVTRELDGGPVVIQARLAVRDGEDESDLATRVLAQEHRIYPQAIGWFAAGRLEYRDGTAWLDGRRLDRPVVVEEDDELPA